MRFLPCQKLCKALQNKDYRVTGRRVTERLDDDANFSPFCGARTSFTRESPSFFCHQIAIGLEIAIVEFVPRTSPTKRASEKLFSTSPPNKTRAKTDNKTKPDVMIVLESVWLIE